MARNDWSGLLYHEYRVFGQNLTRTSTGMLPDDPLTLQQSPSAREDLKGMIEQLSNGQNTVLFDEAGVPSVMVRVPLERVCDLVAGSVSDAPHPAFRLGGRSLPEIWVGKYLASEWHGSLASLPFGKPLRFPRYDEALRACYAKGPGWCAMPFQVRAALALKSFQAGTLPRGNNDMGYDYFHRVETGEPTGDGTVLTGSGPLSWSHNGRPDGVWDMNGNLNEWDAGLRLMDGEIQVQDMASLLRGACAEWHALDSRGQARAPGMPGTLHYEAVPDGIRLTTHPVEPGIGNCAFQDIRPEEGLEADDELRAWGLYPPRNTGDAVLGWRWVATEGEVVPLSGGAYRALDHAGIFFSGITKPGNRDYSLSGIRFIYANPLL